MKVKGLKKAVGKYQRVNSEGYYSLRYGNLMFDESDGTLWCDEFYSLGHNSWIEYHDSAIINIGKRILEKSEDAVITMASVKKYILENYKEKFTF